MCKLFAKFLEIDVGPDAAPGGMTRLDRVLLDPSAREALRAFVEIVAADIGGRAGQPKVDGEDTK